MSDVRDRWTRDDRRTACRGCGAPMRWITMARSGSAMPVDDPRPIARVVIDGSDGPWSGVSADGETFRGWPLDQDHAPEVEAALAELAPEPVEGFTSHFASCPAAPAFRSRPKVERTAEGPRVVNRHHFAPREGFGPARPRGGVEMRPELPPSAVYVGRGTPLGNPHTGDGAIERFRDHLRDLVRRRDAATMIALSELGPDSVLVCSCAPRPCHADVIAEAWRAMRRAGMLAAPGFPRGGST